MGRQLAECRILVSCPSDCEAYKEVVLHTISILNDFSERFLDTTLKSIYYRDNLATGAASSVQEVINPQIAGAFDIYVGLFWSKLGTPTRTHGSGTLEELEMALCQAKEESTVGVHVYFSDEDVPKTLWATSNLSGVGSLKGDLGTKGVLYKTFDSDRVLQRSIGIDLSNDLQKLCGNDSTTGKEEPDAQTSTSAREQGTRKQAAFQSPMERRTAAIAYAESVTRDFKQLASILEVLRNSTNRYTESTKSRTAEVARVGKMNKAFAMKSAMKAIYPRIVQDIEAFNSELLTFLDEAPVVASRSMLEVDLLLDLLKDQRKHIFSLYFKDVFSDLRETTIESLKSFLEFRHTIVGTPSYSSSLIEPRTGLVRLMGQVEEMFVQLILDLDRLLTLNSKP